MFLLIGPAPPLPPELWQATQDESLYTGPSPSPPWPRGSFGHPFPVEDLVADRHRIRFRRSGIGPGQAATGRLANHHAQPENPRPSAGAPGSSRYNHGESLPFVACRRSPARRAAASLTGSDD